MADTVKDRENKDADESGRPVQLPEDQGGKIGQRHDDEQDKHDMKPGPKPGQQHQNR